MTSEPALSNTTGPDPDEESTMLNNDVSMTEDGEEEEGEEEEEEEEEGEEYRCDICNGIFHSLTQFMDHRNFDCTPGRSSIYLGKREQSREVCWPDMLVESSSEVLVLSGKFLRIVQLFTHSVYFRWWLCSNCINL